jgi:hypothetical protein
VEAVHAKHIQASILYNNGKFMGLRSAKTPIEMFPTMTIGAVSHDAFLQHLHFCNQDTHLVIDFVRYVISLFQADTDFS